jgi:hypothetical protein
MKHPTIVGMFLVLDSPDHEHYRTGQIIAAAGSCYLVKFDRVEVTADGPPSLPLELYTAEELSESCKDCGQKRANLFQSRTDMERWITWVETPEKPPGDGTVVHLKKPH